MTLPESESELRKKKVGALRKKGINPYPSKAEHSSSVGLFIDMFGDHEKKGDTVILSGRVMLMRAHGKITFAHVADETGKIQVVFAKQDMGDDAYAFVAEYIDVGDIVQVSGTAFVTKKGEQSLLVQQATLLSKAINPLPDKWHGIKDEEARYRKRYLDMLMNPELRDMVRKKSMFWNAVRDFLQNEGFLEVETPVLEAVAGGADAQPFVTHHNALDIDLFLRISMGELWQKRLMVAGFDKTFEIGRQFRNEGISPEHLQDYTQMEFYWGYADYEMGMELVERMYKECINKTFGTLKFSIKGMDVDLSKKWDRIDYVDALKKAYKLDVLQATENELRTACNNAGSSADGVVGKGRLMDLLWKQVRKTITGPAFLVNHPVEVSPLAKRKEDNPALVERFQVIIAGSEQGNGYSELNDPIDQRQRFEEQTELREAGDTEAQMHDEDFVEALEYGMPPTCGFGMSERLFSFLMDKPIRECVTFPLLRPKQDDNKDNNA
ncbi:MAG: lysine--tRNA ligase [Candidatus Kerfeldbacteria bacterium]